MALSQVDRIKAVLRLRYHADQVLHDLDRTDIGVLIDDRGGLVFIEFRLKQWKLRRAMAHVAALQLEGRALYRQIKQWVAELDQGLPRQQEKVR